jgi:hypothetical protein
MVRMKFKSVSMRGAVITAAIAAALIGQPAHTFAASPPPEAAQVGYSTNTFSSNFTTATVDLKNTKNKGFQWYLWDLYSVHPNPANVVLNSDGTVTLLGTPQFNGQLVTAVPYAATNTFAGNAFGGGAYFEAEMKFDPQTVQAATQGWPAFWALSIEGNGYGSTQWPGQSAGYVHSVETDFFEKMRYSPQTPAGYGGSLHDWYGIYKQTCSKGFCEETSSTGYRPVPAGTDFTQFHRYGFLWVPATASSAGYAKFYIDDQQLGPAQNWQLYTNQPPPAADQPWAFGVLDQRHQFLILGTGPSQPLTVRAVNVWQRAAASNLAH